MYGVSSGEYSDWIIVAVFHDEEKAKMYSALNSFNPYIEQIALNPEVDESLIDKRPVYCLSMNKEGDVRYISKYRDYSDIRDKMPISKIGDSLYINVRADSEEEAVKIASEKRRMYIANDYKN